MASFLFVSKHGDNAFLARRFKMEGHKTRLFVTDKNCRDLYNGIVEKATSATPVRGDTVVVGSSGLGEYADTCRKAGFPVVGGGRFSDNIELHRGAGMALMESSGIPIPETKLFKNVQEGIRFLAKQTGEWFYKPSGEADSGDTVGGPIDIVSRFMNVYPYKEFILQKKMEGLEISLEGWFDGRKFVYPFNSTVEDKRFLAGDLGPNVGCMGNVVWTYEEPHPRLAMQTLERIVPVLQRSGYVGPIDINMMLDKYGSASGLEWTPRFGYDAIQALSMLAPSNWGEQLAEFALGKLNKFDMRGEYGMTINVSIPPYPIDEYAESAKGMPFDRTIMDHPYRILLRDIMVDKYGLPSCAGVCGIVACFGTAGKYIPAMQNELQSFIKEFKIPSAQYRNDCCNRAIKVIDALPSMLLDLPFMAPEPVVEIPLPAMPNPAGSRGATYIPFSTSGAASKSMNINLQPLSIDVADPPHFGDQ